LELVEGADWKLTGGKTQPRVGQAPKRWKVCAEAREMTDAATTVILRVATMIAIAQESQLATNKRLQGYEKRAERQGKAGREALILGHGKTSLIDTTVGIGNYPGTDSLCVPACQHAIMSHHHSRR
jgi:hypothetical protein